MKIEVQIVRDMINEVYEALDSDNAYGDGVREACNQFEKRLDSFEVEVDEELY